MRDLALRRQMLLARATAQRRAAAQAAAGLQRGLSSVERTVGILRYVGRKPLVIAVAAAVAGLFIAKPRQTATWLGYAITGYTMFRRARRALFSQGVN
jgi:propanediol dehydratase large subunit